MSEPSANRIHYTQLPIDPPGKRGATEWNFYRGEVGRLLAEGHEGKYVLVKGPAIIGMWDTAEEAYAVARQKFLGQDVLIIQVRTWEPLVRTPLSYCQCHS
jgi:uncharacterized protein DUF5678